MDLGVFENQSEFKDIPVDSSVFKCSFKWIQVYPSGLECIQVYSSVLKIIQVN